MWRPRGTSNSSSPPTTRFIGASCDTAGNPIAQRFYGSLGDRQRRMMTDAVRADSRRLCLLVDEHVELVAAVAHRDPHAFETALLAHLEVTYHVVLG